MSLAVLFLFLCAQDVSDMNMSIIRSLRLFCWITTLIVLFLVQSNQEQYDQCRVNQEQYDQCRDSTAQSQAPDDGHINVWNMLST